MAMLLLYVIRVTCRFSVFNNYRGEGCFSYMRSRQPNNFRLLFYFVLQEFLQEIEQQFQIYFVRQFQITVYAFLYILHSENVTFSSD